MFLDRSTLEKRHPGVSLAGIPDEGAITMAVRVVDIAKATAVLGGRAAVKQANVVKVAPAEANGVILEFLQA